MPTGTYAPGEQIIGHGKKISYSTDGTTFIDVLATTEVELPESELGKAESTNDSSPDFHKEYLPGMYEPGTIGFKYRYGKTQFTALQTQYAMATVAATRAAATITWKVTLTDGSTGTVKGFLTKHTLPSADQEDVFTVEAEIQCTGKMTFAAGT